MSKEQERMCEFEESERTPTPPLNREKTPDGTDDLIKNLRKSLSDLTKVKKIEESYGIPAEEKQKMELEGEEIQIPSDSTPSPAIHVEYVDHFEDEVGEEEKVRHVQIKYKPKTHRKRTNENHEQEEEYVQSRLAKQNEIIDSK